MAAESTNAANRPPLAPRSTGSEETPNILLVSQLDTSDQTYTINGSAPTPKHNPNSDLAAPIAEDDETGTESPNEPVTPVDRHPSQPIRTVPAPDLQDPNQQPFPAPTSDPQSAAPAKESPLVKDAPIPPANPSANGAGNPSRPPPRPVADQDLKSASGGLPRRNSRPAEHSFKRSVSNLFKRTNSISSAMRPDMGFTEPRYNGSSETVVPNDVSQSKDRKGVFSLNNSSNTTRSNTPPSPGSPTDATAKGGKPNGDSPPSTAGDLRKNRASTGLTLRGRAINFVQAGTPGRDKQPKKKPFARRRSFDSDKSAGHDHFGAHPHDGHHGHHHHMGHIAPSPWPQMPDAGVGVKSRRLSISLPDDFHVEVEDLQSAYQYQNKLFGRHGKHLGKGATSKVTLMARKGFPNELYAVKEFLNKRKAESTEDYEKKVKSEYSIAKSLHHPNIVETIALCTDHGRWNHVMEYCSDGDLFQLVAKGYLKGPMRAIDRLCLFKQALQGVNYLHCNGIAHRDIKLENCLISNGSKLKITDFGVSEVFSGTHPGLREAGGQCGKNMHDVRLCSPGICGSEPYVAPEVLRKDSPYDPRGMDVWGCAIIMICLTFGANIWQRAQPNSGSSTYDMFIKQWDKWHANHQDDPDPHITETDYPYFLPFDEFVNPPALRRILLRMLNPDPAKRVSMSDVINHRWIKGVECCQLDSYDDPAQHIDASKKGATRVNGQKKIFCHNHLPVQSHGHSLPKMPGQPGY